MQPHFESLINPVILYTCLALGGVGVLLALPRKGGGPQALGGLIAAIFFGGIVLTLAVVAGENRPNLFFYVFALIALGASLRVISHPRPVYAALYFILTILSSAGLYLLLEAEFMTFALIIIYAGAILITYLFVIMLATEAPSAEATEALKEYDSTSREPIAATAVGFVLLALLTGLMSKGVPMLPQAPNANPDMALKQMPKKVEAAFARLGLLEDATIESYNAQNRDAFLVLNHPERFMARFAAAERVANGKSAGDIVPFSEDAAKLFRCPNMVVALPPLKDGKVRSLVHFPEDLHAENIELVGLALLNQHPLAIELAGVILLLALVGAVILARKQVEAGQVQMHTSPSTLGEGGMTLSFAALGGAMTLAAAPVSSAAAQLQGITLYHYLFLSAAMFVIGVIGFLSRRNLIIMFLCTELMFQAAGLALIAFGRYWLNHTGDVFVIIVLTIAAAEAALALGLVVYLFKRKETLDSLAWAELKG